MPDLGPVDAFDICERLRLRVSRFNWGTIAAELSLTLSAGIASTPTTTQGTWSSGPIWLCIGPNGWAQPCCTAP